MPKLRSLPSLVRATNTSPATLPPKVKADIYNTDEYKAWRTYVVGRAGYRCEAVVRGHRCSKAWPDHRLYADHIIELKDGGQPFDVANGQCLCASHHTNKTMAKRFQRYSSSVDGG